MEWSYNQVITSSSSAMRPVTLYLRKDERLGDAHWKKTILEILEVKRKFSRINIDSLRYEDDEDTLKVVKVHKSTLLHVEINKGWIDLQSTMNLLATIENLRSINIESTHCSLNGMKNFKSVNLR